MGRFLTIVFATLMVAMPATAGKIEGGKERQKFVPGDEVIYQSALDECPVGEVLPEWRVVKGGYECARYENHVWIRPLSHGTKIWLPIQPPLPEEFSFEMTAVPFKEGRPGVRFAFHPVRIAERMHEARNNELIAGIIAAGDPTPFGAKDDPRGSLDGRFSFTARFEPGKPHRVAVQVRRGQVRFFVDGRRIGILPFRPGEPIGVLSLEFFRHFSVDVPFADAPVLVRNIRIAGYRGKEAAPKPEEDLAAELGAVQTDEGLKVTLENEVLFDFGKWQLRPEALDVLDKVARLASTTQGAVRVEGHTDNVGSEAYNKVLSELRAHVVALELARRGADPKRLRPVGFGETRPVAPNDSEENRRRNRRVEIILE